ncbi:7811_t:CDS:2 [Funneliformis caledonium]|uniref:7811_t:CDS:1 n=1 Tax=Funneliformis caledonium TaxID=1117310 RepID=A0A9N8Z1G4_9GLOM|nr:7811_t:CDS:2 [Funneliformis caledonium]
MRIIKVNYVLFQALWSVIPFLPLLAEYGYQRFFVLKRKRRQIIKENIYYGSHLNTNRLDLYIPDTAKLQQQLYVEATHPVIVFLYGGGWSSGDKLLYILLALRLRRLGYVVVVPNYTLYPNGKIDSMISDVKLSLIWTSAHLAALVTIRDAIIKSETIEGRVNSKLVDIDPELELPKINGLILLAGVYDISRHFLWESKRGLEELSAMARVMGDTEENFALNSPTILLENALKSSDINLDKLKSLMPPKILFIHGIKDTTVPLEATLRFNYVLNQLCIKDLRLRMPTDMDHFDPVSGLMYHPRKNKISSQLQYELAVFMSF